MADSGGYGASYPSGGKSFPGGPASADAAVVDRGEHHEIIKVPVLTFLLWRRVPMLS